MISLLPGMLLRRANLPRSVRRSESFVDVFRPCTTCPLWRRGSRRLPGSSEVLKAPCRHNFLRPVTIVPAPLMVVTRNKLSHWLVRTPPCTPGLVPFAANIRPVLFPFPRSKVQSGSSGRTSIDPEYAEAHSGLDYNLDYLPFKSGNCPAGRRIGCGTSQNSTKCVPTSRELRATAAV